MSGRAETIRCCPAHSSYCVPLIATFKFPGAEQWCPFCGWTTGSFFSDHSVQTPATEELVGRHAVYTAAARPFLSRDGGEGWNYEVRAEDLPAIEPDPNRPEIVCDGCGKRAAARVLAGRCGPVYEKPAHWYQRQDSDGVQTACSMDCVDVIAGRTGKTRMVLPW